MPKHKSEETSSALDSSPHNLGLFGARTKRIRSQEQLARNRESARLSRARKKALLPQQEETIGEQAREIRELQRRLSEVRGLCQTLQELSNFQGRLIEALQGLPPHKRQSIRVEDTLESLSHYSGPEHTANLI